MGTLYIYSQVSQGNKPPQATTPGHDMTDTSPHMNDIQGTLAPELQSNIRLTNHTPNLLQSIMSISGGADSLKTVEDSKNTAKR